MISRRRLFEAAGVGAALAGMRFGLPDMAAAAGIDLPPQLPEGVRENATLETLPGKKPLIKLSYRPPNYETPIEHFRTAITPNDAFFVRYHLSSIPAGRCEDLEARRSAATAQTVRPNSRSTTSGACRRSRWLPSTSARATGAGCFSRMFRASNGATARWAARAGTACGSRTCSTRPVSRRRRSRSRSTAPIPASSTRRRISSRASRPGRRSRTRPSWPTR